MPWSGTRMLLYAIQRTFEFVPKTIQRCPNLAVVGCLILSLTQGQQKFVAARDLSGPDMFAYILLVHLVRLLNNDSLILTAAWAGRKRMVITTIHVVHYMLEIGKMLTMTQSARTVDQETGSMNVSPRGGEGGLSHPASLDWMVCEACRSQKRNPYIANKPWGFNPSGNPILLGGATCKKTHATSPCQSPAASLSSCCILTSAHPVPPVNPHHPWPSVATWIPRKLDVGFSCFSAFCVCSTISWLVSVELNEPRIWWVSWVEFTFPFQRVQGWPRLRGTSILVLAPLDLKTLLGLYIWYHMIACLTLPLQNTIDTWISTLRTFCQRGH